MRIVTYARVSTKGQADRGISLHDQETRFTEWLKRSKHTRVRAYAEATSGGKNMQERTFKAMLEDLPHLGVDALVVDSLDRFTRDKVVGMAMTHQLRQMGVKLWELEYSDSEPFDLNDDEHRDYVAQRFADAEAERRRIKKRQLKRYTEQRNRGATTTNRPAFGLMLDGEERGRRRVVPDPQTAPIVQEVDRRILAGESQSKVLEWLRSVAPEAWKSRRGLQLALLDLPDDKGRGGNAYIVAGVRTPEVQAALRERYDRRRQAYGEDRLNGTAEWRNPFGEWSEADLEALLRDNGRTARYHDLTGLVACGLCVDAGIDPHNALMHGRYVTRNVNPHALACDGHRVPPGKRNQVRTHEKEFWVGAHLVRPLIVEKLHKLRDPAVARAVLERWAKEPRVTKSATMRRTLERRLAELDGEEAALDARVNAAVRLMASGKPGVAKEAERVLDRASADRLTLGTQREAIQSQLAKLAVPRERSAEIGRLERLMADAEAFMWGERLSDDGTTFVSESDRALLKAWIDALGPPLLRRVERKMSKNPRYELSWPFIDAVRSAPAADYA